MSDELWYCGGTCDEMGCRGHSLDELPAPVADYVASLRAQFAAADALAAVVRAWVDDGHGYTECHESGCRCGLVEFRGVLAGYDAVRGKR